MLPTTADAVRALLKADVSLTTADRTRIITTLRNHGKKEEPVAPVEEDRIVRRRETAKLLARSLRGVDLLRSQGVLRPVILPGRKRVAGYRLSDIRRLIQERNENG